MRQNDPSIKKNNSKITIFLKYFMDITCARHSQFNRVVDRDGQPI